MTTPQPPRRAESILARALGADPAAPSILGDLREDYARIHGARGPGAARRWYWREALLLSCGRLIRGAYPSTDGASPMFASPTALFQDAAYALRTLRRSPGFAVFTAVVIGLGVGAATSVFSVLRPLMLAPLPFEDSEALVWIEHAADPGATSLSAVTSRSGNLRDFRERSRSFDGLTGYNAFFNQGTYTLTGGGEPEQLMGAGVAHDFLDVLGIRPAIGRSFTEPEGMWDGPDAVILTHGFWTRRFAADPGVVGRSVSLDGQPHEVVGVLPPTFDFTSVFTPSVEVDFLVPFPVGAETDRWGNTMFMIGRLRPGVSPEAAQQELDAIVAALQEAQPDRWGLSARVSTLRDHVAGPFRSALMLLAFAAGGVLLIVCVNVSNLLLARAPARAREVAVRKALGAPRARLVRQLVLETVILSLGGAVLGAGLAAVVTRWVAGTAAVAIPMLDRVSVDAVALAFGGGVALLAGLAVAAIPALQVAEGSEASVLRASGRGHSGSRGANRMREGLVVAEVTLACVLLAVTGLMLRSFQAVLDVDLGFQPANAVVWQLDPSRTFETSEEEVVFFQQVREAVASLPGVDGVGLADASPMGRNRTWGFNIVGEAPDEEVEEGLFPHMVDAGYLDVMGIRLVEGRGIRADDTRGSAPVIVINQTAARRLFGGNAIGRMVRAGGSEEPWEVVGVAEDTRHLTPETGSGIQFYFPFAQLPAFNTLDLVVRSQLPVPAVVSQVREALASLDSAMPTRDHWTLESAVDQAVSARRFTLGILGAFAATALLLAGLGIYGVLAYSVSERRAEIGIRMALGASTGEVIRQVMVRTLTLAGMGVAVGLLASLGASDVVAGLLFGVAPTDPVTLGGIAVVLLGVAALAGAVPAIRAANNDGVRALRAE
ncbi:MAG: ADOP family duplicated permease [Longimicrobiales bacterium]